MNRPEKEYEVTEWAAKRNAMAARYSAMLGVENPVLAELAQALGLTPTKQENNPPASVGVGMSAFGV